MNVAELFERVDPQATAVLSAAGRTRYGELVETSGRLASALAARGLRPGDRIALAVGDAATHIVAHLAVLRAGGVAVTLNAQAPAPELSAALRLARPATVVGGAAAGPAPDGAIPVADLLREARGLLGPVPRADDDPATVLFTSGSTGRPKGVVLSHGNLRWAAAAQASRMPSPTSGAGVTALLVPLHHCYGQNAVLLATAAQGGTLALLDPRRRRRLVEDLRALGVTALPAVPATFQLLLDLGAGPDSLPALRYAVSAAAELPEPVATEWERRFGFAIHEGYGLTETSPCALYNDRVTSPPGTLGRPFDGVRTRVVDDRGRAVPPGTTGVLQLAGPNVMQGYLDDPEATAAAVADGWLTTGDCVRQDAAGDLWLVGRQQNVINVAGAKVHPSEVEAALHGAPGVAEAVVVGRPHPVVGEIVTAFVRTAPDAGWDDVVRGLRARCRERLAPYKRPASFRYLAQVPRLASGKPDLPALRRLAAAPAAATPQAGG